MTIIAFIVTHNRLPLLKECVEGVRKQTHPVSRILVINNHSTDGTDEWLAQQNDITTFTQENLGCSFGCYTGINESYALGADWVWVMDDDTVPDPHALQKIVTTIEELGPSADEFGFFSSKVVWTDGSLHNKNMLPYLQETDYCVNGKTIKGLRLIRSGTFVSILFSRAAIEKVGLPIKEFFIWHDDVEYSERITRAGFKGGAVDESSVLHKTPDNLNNNLFSDDRKSLWKYYYGIRNQLYVRRDNKGQASFYRNALKHLFYWPLLIMVKRKDSRWDFIKTVWRGTLASFSFYPEKDPVRK